MRAKTKAQAKFRDKKASRPKANTKKGAQNGPRYARCPDCNARIVFSQKTWLNQPILCPTCESDLIIVSLAPIELDFSQ